MYGLAKCCTPGLLRSGFKCLVMSVASGLAMCTLLLAVSGASFADDPQPTLPLVELEVNDLRLSTEVASTARQRFMGLSFRRSLDTDAGMLFVYESTQSLTFTMRNTLIPLSIAFISADLVINEIHHMDVGPGQLFPSNKPAQYALEVNQGWFEANGIEPGMRLTLSTR